MYLGDYAYVSQIKTESFRHTSNCAQDCSCIATLHCHRDLLHQVQNMHVSEKEYNYYASRKLHVYSTKCYISPLTARERFSVMMERSQSVTSGGLHCLSKATLPRGHIGL